MTCFQRQVDENFLVELWDLCPNCQQLNLEVALDLSFTSLQCKKDGIIIGDIPNNGVHHTQHRCRLCRILRIARLENWNRSEHAANNTELQLRAFPFLEQFAGIDFLSKHKTVSSNDNGLVSILVVPSDFSVSNELHCIAMRQHFWGVGHLVCCDKSKSAPEIFAPTCIKPNFDPSTVLPWLRHCQLHHKRICGARYEQVPGLKLIDCNSFTIVPAPQSAPYTALSYVWDASEIDNQQKTTKTVFQGKFDWNTAPNVIRNAVQATKALEIRYLWVDKYCIDQNNPQIKHELIRSMGLIYQNAQLTIVAAAGNGEADGLPGVGGTPRALQPRTTIGNISIISTLAYPHKSIFSSKWATRGWTYQEAVLSTRRLVFTTHQIYFECNAMNCYESLSSSLEALHTRDGSRFRSWLRAGMFGRTTAQAFGGFDVENIGKDQSFIRYLASSQDYTARNLSYDNDSLNAFSGIIRHFENIQGRVLQMCGIPFLPPGEFDGGSCLNYLVDGLCWNHTNGVWDTNRYNRPYRRPEFPSWSWAGWKGAIVYESRDYKKASTFISAIRDLHIRVKGEGKIEFIHYFKGLTEYAFENIRRELYFEAWVIPPDAFSLHPSFDGAYNWTVFNFPAKVTMSQGPKNAFELLDGLTSKNWRCLILGRVGKQIYTIIVSRAKDALIREGMMIISCWLELELGRNMTLDSLSRSLVCLK